MNRQTKEYSTYTLFHRLVSPSGRVSYVPWAESVNSRDVGHGNWLVVSKPTVVSYRPVDPAYVELAAAADVARGVMIEAMLKEKGILSIATIVDAGVRALMEEAVNARNG